MKVGLNTFILLICIFLLLIQNSFGQVVYTINSVDDFEDMDLADSFCADKNGNCTLRAAIQNINKTKGKCKVNFNIQGVGPFKIKLRENLPKISSPIDLDATTQSGYALDSPQIILDGSDVFVKLARYDVEKAAVILHLIKGSNDSAIRGFVISGVRGVGIFISSDNNAIQQNFVGTTPDGCNAFKNTTGIFLKGMGNLVGGEKYGDGNLISGNGVGIFTNAKNSITGNYIGTTIDGNSSLGNEIGIALVRFSKSNLISENLISGNRIGIDMVGDNNRVFQNKIGTNASGDMKIPNETGIRLVSARHNIIGGKGLGNLISGNNKFGIFLFKYPVFDIPDTNNEIKGNIIGLDITGTQVLGNETGILIEGGRSDYIGGINSGERNVISGNSEVGIEIKNVDGFLIQGNFIGTDFLGKKAAPNGLGVRFSDDPINLGLGESTFADNVVSGNFTHGIEINGLAQHAFIGNFIGTASDGIYPLPNRGNGLSILKVGNLDCIGGDSNPTQNLIAHNHQNGIEILDAGPMKGDLQSIKKRNRIFENFQTDFSINRVDFEEFNK
jgi:parallel beta-helix repeat protein